MALVAADCNGYLEEVVGLLHFNVLSLLCGRANVLGQEVNRFGCVCVGGGGGVVVVTRRLL